MTDDRSEWLAARRKGIGGSDEHHVYSEPPYGCARLLWFDKRGVEPDYPGEYTALMERGHDLEEPVAQLYARRTGRTLIRRETLRSTEHPWALVNIDREIAPIDDRGPGVLEIKTTNLWGFRKIKTEGLLPGYVLQLQHALLVTGLQWGAFAVCHPDSWQIVCFDVARDETLIASMIDAGARFWRQVEHGPMPEALPEIDRRCQSCSWRRQCRGEALLKAARIPKDDAAMAIEQATDLDDIVADYREAKKVFDDAEETLDIVKDALKSRLGERQAVQTDGTRIYYREQVSMRVDSQGLRVKYPEIFKEVQKPSVSRPLRIYDV